MAFNNIVDFGNGQGLLYITEPNGTSIVTTVPNNYFGAQAILRDSLIRSPLGGIRAAVGTVTISAPLGTITNITVNGVGIMGASAATGATVLDVAQDAVNKINTATSVPNYVAVLDSSVPTVPIIIINDASSQGDLANGYVVAAAVTGGMTVALQNMDGGSDSEMAWDEALGARYFLNSSLTAVGGDLTGSSEISEEIIPQIFRSGNPENTGTISSATLGILGGGVTGVQVQNVDTEGAAATDDLDNIIAPEGASNGLILIVKGVSAARVTTITTAGNVVLNNSLPFATGDGAVSIGLQYKDGFWYEIFRSPNVEVSIANFRVNGIAYMYNGVDDNAVVAAGGTVFVNATANKEYQLITSTGLVVLVAGQSFTPSGLFLDGDHFYFDYKATLDTTAFPITIFGYTLTTEQALEGALWIHCYYDQDAGSWRVQAFSKTDSVDFATTTELALKEDYLGLPASDGYVLSSTALGVRSWIPPSTTPTPISNIDEKAWNTDFTLTGGTDKNYIRVKPTSSTQLTTADRIVTLTPTPGENNSFVLYLEPCRVGATFEFKIQYNAVDLFVLKQGTVDNIKIECLYNDTLDEYLIRHEGIDGSRVSNTGVLYIEKTFETGWITGQYLFSTLGGAVSTISLSTVLPAGIILFLEDAYISTIEAFTSGGAATIAWGISGIATNTVDAATAYTDAKYAAVNAVGKNTPTGDIVKIVTPASLTFTIAGAALTAGGCWIRIPFQKDPLYV